MLDGFQWFGADFSGELCELIELGLGEVEAAGFVGTLAGFGFELAGENALFVSVTEDVADDFLEVLHLAAAFGESIAGNGVRVDHLEIESGAGFLAGACLGCAPTNAWKRSADERTVEFIEKAHRVALVRTEGKKGDDFVRVSGWVAILVDGRVWRKLFAFALECLHAAHGDDGSGPVADQRETYGIRSRKSP